MFAFSSPLEILEIKHPPSAMGCWFGGRRDIDKGVVQKAANASDTLEPTVVPSQAAHGRREFPT